jgi:hypothetical protein
VELAAAALTAAVIGYFVDHFLADESFLFVGLLLYLGWVTIGYHRETGRSSMSDARPFAVIATISVVTLLLRTVPFLAPPGCHRMDTCAISKPRCLPG